MRSPLTRDRGGRGLRNRSRRGEPYRHPPRESDSDGTTLEERISVIWANLVEAGTAECPVCARQIAPGQSCGGCGSLLT